MPVNEYASPLLAARQAQSLATAELELTCSTPRSRNRLDCHRRTLANLNAAMRRLGVQTPPIRRSLWHRGHRP